MRHFLNIAIVLLVQLLICSSVFAEDFSAKTQLQADTANGAFFSKSIPVVKVSGFNREAIFSRHEAVDLKAFDLKDATVFNDTRITSIGNSDFSLAIYANGEMVSFDNNRLHRESILNWNKVQGISLSEAQKIAENYLETNIKPFLSLSSHERIVPFHVMYQHYGEGEAEKIIAYNIVFSRMIDDIHVIGAGSKIRITVGVDGAVIGYRYDWSKIDSIDYYKSVSGDELNNRKKQVCKNAHVKCEALKTVDRFECGIYDPGALHRYNNVVNSLQPACFISARASQNDAQSYATFIPLLEREFIVVDQNWVETGMIVNDSDITNILPSIDGKIQNN